MDELLSALWHIADYPAGGFVVPGKCSGDRSDMIHSARRALMNHYGVNTMKAAAGKRLMT